MKFDLFLVVGTMIELNRSNTKLAINTSYRSSCKFSMAIIKGSGDTGLYKIRLIIAKEIVTMTTTGPCEMSGPSPRFFGAGSKFPYVLYIYSSGSICLLRTIRGGGGQPRNPLSW